MTRLIERLAATLLLAALAAPASALNLQFKPSVHVEYTRDSNVYRVPDDSQLLGRPPRIADRITTVGAGGRLTLRESLQELEVQGGLDRDQYAELSNLDNTRYDVDTVARLALGSTIKANLEAARQKRLESFAYRDDTQKGFITSDQQSASLRYAIAARVNLDAKFTHSSTSASLPSSRDYDLRENAGEVGADYVRGGYSSAGLALRYAHGEYPNRAAPAGSGVERAYDQQTVLLRSSYTPSGLSDFKGQLGFTQRTHDDPSVPDFRGLTGQLAYTRRFSGKTQLQATAYRDLYYVEDANANYVENLGLRLAADYRYSAKLALALAAEQYRSSYRGTPRFSQGGETRQDDVSAIKLGVQYQPYYRVYVQPNVRWERRQSNRDDQDYRFNAIGIDLAYDYGSGRRP